MTIIWCIISETWSTTDRIFCHFGPFFPLCKKWKMKKIARDITILHKCTKNHDHMLHCSWDTIGDRCKFYFSSWAIFCPFTPLTTQKIKILKNWKKAWRYHHFTHAYQKLWSHDVWFLRQGAQQTDKQEKSHTEVVAPPKNSNTAYKSIKRLKL